jgi:hypothetical protein
VGAAGGVADTVHGAMLPHATASVVAEVAAGCGAVGVLCGLLLASALGAAWAAARAGGEWLRRTWPSSPRAARDVPLAAALLAVFTRDCAQLFSGHGVSQTAFAAVGRWMGPVAAASLALVVLRAGERLHEALADAPLARRVPAFIACVVVAAVFMRLQRAPTIAAYASLRRDCNLAVFVAVLFGLSLLVSGPRLRVTGAEVGAIAAMASALALYLPFALRGGDARAALAQGTFVASPEIHALRHLVDLDGDGYSPIAGGGDCNDFNAAVHPFAHDVPGNGVDEDCDGVDALPPGPGGGSPRYGVPNAVATTSLRASARRKNVLVILEDALRFDRVDGARAASFPRLAALWQDGIAFTRALAPASRTPIALPVILDGREPPQQGSRLFRAAAAAGVRAAFASVDVVLSELCLGQRFEGAADLIGISTSGDRDSWGGGIRVFTGQRITQAALGWLDATDARDRSAPWLLWAHYFSAHQWDRIDAVSSIADLGDRYDAALADDDRAIGALLDGLRARGLADDTIVVLLADHGESLGDRGWRTHGSYLYPELIHVPLSIRIPGVAPRRIATAVPTAALTPTLLDLLSIAAARDGDADSLVPLMAADAPGIDGAPGAIRMHDTLQDAMAAGRWMLRVTPTENVTELYPLGDLDALEPENLVGREPAAAQRLTAMLEDDPPPAR